MIQLPTHNSEILRVVSVRIDSNQGASEILLEIFTARDYFHEKFKVIENLPIPHFGRQKIATIDTLSSSPSEISVTNFL